MSDSDGALVDRAREGDREAFEQLVRRHIGAAHAVALAVTGDRGRADDLCQDAFLTALQRLDSLADGDRFRGWILRIVRNRALDDRRGVARFRHMPIEEVELTSGGAGPEQELERTLLRERLSRALQQLPEREREILVLHDLEGWKHREIGERLGMLEGTVRHHLFRARRKMRASLAPLMDEGETNDG